MARKKRNILWADANAKFTGSGNKWEGQELDDTLADYKDSLTFEDEAVTIGSNTFDCAESNRQTRVLTANGTLAIINPETDRWYSLLIKGNFSLTLPSGQYYLPNGTVPASANPRWLTFTYDGTNYYFNHGTYSTT